MPNPNAQFPAQNIVTDQGVYPFSALLAVIKRLIAALFGAGASTVVWRPGVASSGNVFDTWVEVVAAVAKLNGAVTIGLDTDTAAAVIPPGDYDLRPAGVSGPVTFVDASKNPPFNAPFFQIGPGAVTIKGLTGLDNVQVDNQSTVPVMAITQTGSFTMSQLAEIFQTGAGAFWNVTAGAYSIFMRDFSILSDFGGGDVLLVAAPATVLLGIEDEAAIDANMITAAAASLVVGMNEGGRYFAQAGAPAIVPSVRRQVGTASIVAGTGKTAAIAVSLRASSVIQVTLRTPVGDALTVKYGALDADRVNGAVGSFKISALLAAGGGAVNGADTSTLGWEVIDGP